MAHQGRHAQRIRPPALVVFCRHLTLAALPGGPHAGQFLWKAPRPARLRELAIEIRQGRVGRQDAGQRRRPIAGRQGCDLV